MTDTRCALIAIIGAPNAGKSTLVNAASGTKVSIVSPKPQTTRFRIRAVVMRPPAQLILVDTPGIFAPKRRLDRAMVAAAWGGAQDADIALLVVDAKAGFTEAVRAVVDKLKGGSRPIWLALNKIDLIDRQQLLPLTAALNAELPFAETFMLSATKGDGIDLMLQAMAVEAPAGPWLFPEDELSDLPNRMLAAEIVREHILRLTHDEVPHHSTVETESWKEFQDGSARVDLTIFVSRPTQKAILIGEGGAKIKDIGRRARQELSALLERKIHLFLNVKDRANWDDSRTHIRALGLDDAG